MKYTKYVIAVATLMATTQVNAELPVKFQLSADAYLYDMEETVSIPGYLEVGKYDGSLFGATLKMTPTDTSIPWSGDISIRDGQLDGDYRDSTLGVLTQGTVNVDRTDVELSLNYSLTSNIFLTAGWYYVQTDETVSGAGWSSKSDSDIHLFPVGIGFGTTEKLGDFYITPKASLAYLFGKIDRDLRATGGNSSISESLSGYEMEVTVIVDRPLSEDSSLFGEVGYRTQEFDGGDTDNSLAGPYIRLGYRWAF